MSDWRKDIANAIADFAAVAELAGSPLQPGDVTVEFLDAPHRPPKRLPAGKMAVYGFWHGGEWLKVGKVGSKSQARYVSQHYGLGRALSSLPGSLIKDSRSSALPGFSPASAGDWVKAHTNRVNILLPSERGKRLLSLLEAFLHARLEPRYEGA